MPADTTCGSARRARSVAAAETGSLKTRAEVELWATICAWVERLRTMPSRKVTSSYVAKAAQARKRAAPAASTVMTVNLRLMERLSSRRMSAPRSRGDDAPQLQELRAELEP